MSLKVFASDLSQLLFILKLATFLQPLEVLYLHNVYNYYNLYEKKLKSDFQ